MEKELEKIEYSVPKFSAHGSPLSKDEVVVTLHNYRESLDEAYQAGIRRAVEVAPKDDNAKDGTPINFASNISSPHGDTESYQFGFRRGYSCHQNGTLTALDAELHGNK